MSMRRSPESRAREAVAVLAVGLVVLTLLVVSTGGMLGLAAAQKLVDVARRHLPH
jgi:hypothetical protein